MGRRANTTTRSSDLTVAVASGKKRSVRDYNERPALEEEKDLFYDYEE